jgi:mevalonate kinase
MGFNREQVLNVLIQALKDAQHVFQEEASEIDEKTCPIGELMNFDSLTSVMVTFNCLASLDYECELDFPTLFINKKGKALTVGEIVDRIMLLLKN